MFINLSLYILTNIINKMRFLSNKEKKELVEKLPEGFEITKKDKLTEKNSIIFKNDVPFLIILERKFLPHLKSVNEEFYKSVYVDKGAIPFVIKGADVMRPGIQKIDDGIEKNEIILIKDENYNKVLAIGFSTLSSEELKNQEKGKSVIIYHYVGDKYY